MNIVLLERSTLGMDVSLDCFADFGNLTSYDTTRPDQIEERIKDADIVMINKSPMNESTLKNAKNLKYIGEFATGYDNVDIEYCKSRGIRVTNVSGYSTDAVAQHTFAMVLYVMEHLRHYDDYVKSGDYIKSDNFSYFGKTFNELAGKRWGIMGLGNIGRKVAGIAKACGCQVVYYSSTGNHEDKEYERVSLDELLETSDVLSIHCPLTEKTRYIINKDTLAKMKKSAILINAGRGPIVNNSDLYDALVNNIIAGAGLDVLDGEPMKADNPLKDFKDSDRLIITPHMAWASVEARNRCVQSAYDNVKAFLNKEERNVIV